MKKIKPSLRWIIAIFMLSLMSQSGTSSPYPYCFIAAGFWGIAFIAFVVLCLKNKYIPPRPVSTPNTAPKATAAPDYGTFQTAVAGVTFANDDGSDRQQILKDLYVSGADGELSYEVYDYKGKAAVRILHDGDCIGNIPRGKVAEFLGIMERGILGDNLEVEEFFPEDDPDEEDEDLPPKPERIYRADLTVIYKR